MFYTNLIVQDILNKQVYKITMKKEKKYTKGFTLVELMIAITIATVIISIALPAFRSLIQNNRAATQANEIRTALSMARSEAIKRAANVSVCSNSGTTSWQSGWFVQTDANSNCSIDASDGDELLRNQNGLSGGVTLTGTQASIAFFPEGRANSALTLTLVSPDCTGDQNRVISVSITGHVSVQKSACP
ncbi:MAG TPA: prepilin-type N-terminal cleavage/methylation domain-containing protein [Aeromonadales bacterium]|nr:prepilin-type N-terminal cleavage/methylation domain-containing protein [Aeromonadales bacterium]